jgi:hypothetical protein
MSRISHVGETAVSVFKQVWSQPLEAPVVIIEIDGNDILGATMAALLECNLDPFLTRLTTADRQIAMFELPLPPSLHELGRISRALAAKHHVALIPKRVFLSVISDRQATPETFISPRRAISTGPTLSGGLSDPDWTLRLFNNRAKHSRKICWLFPRIGRGESRIAWPNRCARQSRVPRGRPDSDAFTQGMARALWESWPAVWTLTRGTETPQARCQHHAREQQVLEQESRQDAGGACGDGGSVGLPEGVHRRENPLPASQRCGPDVTQRSPASATGSGTIRRR